MLQHCKAKHDFDLLEIVKDLGLDFYGMIKLVNFIRSQVGDGIAKPEINSKEVFSDDKFLQPILEDDALLFCLDEITIDESSRDEPPILNGESITHDQSTKIQTLEAELSTLKSQFADYRLAVEKTLDDRWNAPTTHPSSSTSIPENPRPSKDPDAFYFESYAYNTIHQTMLQDSVRTDAYRDFIYTNKHLFAGKTVLDLGCGTGILSLFCFRAGAARVLAVDNSDIIDRARAIVHANGVGGVVSCLRGRIEEVVLPVQKVDVIVSEWMGYCLLYEAMLDSVLWARDRYLKDGGLMVPSQCTLRVAPVADPEWVGANVTFWRDVYGFEMGEMMEGVHEDVVVRRVEPEVVVGRSQAFKLLELRTIRKEDLTFMENFEVELDRDIDALDGWAIWFDTFFLTSPYEAIDGEARAEKWGSRVDGSNAFTTGPDGRETHWQSGFMAIDHVRSPGQPLQKGQKINGSVEYRRRKDNERELEIEMAWEAVGSSEKGSQCFIMR
ncbi:S-adenosyl-L-methionine-dependent methyltransferase [Viridothelium virens]|uniref:type I protein arginine methyltransferase n=1 Tax=Viridothelium virens TaxID=1048519 RepID=A0A6A6GS79_VIRVR|nr:S-adenosyl-L-methionine-dependent methyltransferase [Viridothelium virens]